MWAKAAQAGKVTAPQAVMPTAARDRWSWEVRCAFAPSFLCAREQMRAGNFTWFLYLTSEQPQIVPIDDVALQSCWHNMFEHSVCACWCIWFVCAITHTKKKIPVRKQICQSTCTNTTFYISVVTTLWELRFKFYRLVHGDFSSTNLARHHFGLTHLAQTATMAGQILLNGLPGAFLSAGWPGPS